MNITDDIINHIAHLARLEFEGERKEQIKQDLANIISFINKLNEVPTDGIDPLIFMNEEVNNLREDVVSATITQEEALKNAPKKDSDYFRIPKVLEK